MHPPRPPRFAETNASTISGFNDRDYHKEAHIFEHAPTQEGVLAKFAEQNSKDSWDSQNAFLLFLITFSNGPIQLQNAASICNAMTGGIFFAFLMFINAVFVYPILVLELFFGYYAKFTYGQIWRMAPLFYGFGISYILLYIAYLVITALNTAHSIIYTISALTGQVGWFRCPENPLVGRLDIECVPASPKIPLQSCVIVSDLLLNCTGYERLIQFPALFYYWQRFGDPDIYQTDFLRNSFLSHMLVWICTCLFLIKGRNYIHKLILISTIFIIFMIIFLIYFLVINTTDTIFKVMKAVFAINTQKMDYSAIRKIFWFTIYKTPVGFPNIYLTSTAYYNQQINPTKYASCLILIGDIYLMSFVILANFINEFLMNEYGSENTFGLLDERGILFATIPEYLTRTTTKYIFTHLYFWSLTTNLLAHHINTAHICLLNVFDYCPHYKELKTQVIFPFCVAMFTLGLPLSYKNIVHCIQTHFVYIISSFGSIMSYTVEVWVFIIFYGVPRIKNDFLYSNGKIPPFMLQVLWHAIPLMTLVCTSATTLYTRESSMLCTNIKYSIEVYYGGLMFVVIIGIFLTFTKAVSENNVMSTIKPTFFWGPPIKEKRIERKLKFSLSSYEKHFEKNMAKLSHTMSSKHSSLDVFETAIEQEDDNDEDGVREEANMYDRLWYELPEKL